jgi:hypothetical protein
MREYANYEFHTEVVEDALLLMKMTEKNHVLTGAYKEPDIDGAIAMGKLAKEVQKKLEALGQVEWRWRILYIRTILEQLKFEYYREHQMSGRYAASDIRNFAGDFLADNEEAQELLKELRKLYHSVEYNGRNMFTLPVVGGETHLGYEGTYKDICARRAKKDEGK